MNFQLPLPPLPKFPQNFRKFTAPLSDIALKTISLLLFSFVIINLLWEKDWLEKPPQGLVNEIQKTPFQSSLHEKLGKYYLPLNLDIAKREYTLAQEFYQNDTPSNTNPLGLTTSPKEIWENLENRKEKLETMKNYWEKVHKKLPKYQFALMELAQISFEMQDYDQAKTYLKAYLEETPMDENALKLAKKIL